MVNICSLKNDISQRILSNIDYFIDFLINNDAPLAYLYEHGEILFKDEPMLPMNNDYIAVVKLTAASDLCKQAWNDYTERLRPAYNATLKEPLPEVYFELWAWRFRDKFKENQRANKQFMTKLIDLTTDAIIATIRSNNITIEEPELHDNVFNLQRIKKTLTNKIINNARDFIKFLFTFFEPTLYLYSSGLILFEDGRVEPINSNYILTVDLRPAAMHCDLAWKQYKEQLRSTFYERYGARATDYDFQRWADDFADTFIEAQANNKAFIQELIDIIMNNITATIHNYGGEYKI